MLSLVQPTTIPSRQEVLEDLKAVHQILSIASRQSDAVPNAMGNITSLLWNSREHIAYLDEAAEGSSIPEIMDTLQGISGITDLAAYVPSRCINPSALQLAERLMQRAIAELQKEWSVSG